MGRFGKFQMMLALGIAMIALGTVAVPEAGAQPPGWKPLALLGYNADVIVDKLADIRYADGFDGDPIGTISTGCCAFFESGAIDDAGTQHDDGIPAGTTFDSLTGSGVVYLIQPAALNNVLQMPRGGSATFTLLTPANYSQIAILASSGNADGHSVGNATINYDDGSSDTEGYNTFDWCAGSKPESAIPPPNGAPGIGRVGQRGADGTKFSYQFTCGPLGFEAYETVLATDSTKKIVSVTFDSGNSNWSNVFGISALK